MKKYFLLLAVLQFVFIIDSSFSLPRFAVRLGDKCIDCHYNPTGGIIRSEDGWNFGKNIMSAISPREQDIAMTPKIGDNISFGVDYRTQFLYSFQRERADFQQMTGGMYTNIGLAKNINLLGRYDFINEIWEAYGVAHIFPNNGYIKAGSFQPNYGIRIDDHTAYTRGGDMFVLFTGGRQGMIYNPFYTEAGVEAGFYIDKWAMITASAGTNLTTAGTFAKDPTYTARLELDPKIGSVGLLLGGSYAKADDPIKSDMYGFFAGFGHKRFALLGEFDFGKNVIQDGIKSHFAMAEASYIITLGLEAVVRYDRIDIDIDSDNNEIQRVVIGLEWFIYSFVELRPQYRIQEGAKNDSAVLQFHFWY